MYLGFMPYVLSLRTWPTIVVALLISAPAISASLYIEPVMVNIPAGQITLQNPSQTTSSSAATEAPTVVVNIKAFRMGKYEVTVKEFGKFIAATNYSATDKCMQMYSKEWFSYVAGSWQGNKHSFSEYEPVTCIGWSSAQAYVEWLSKVTGKHYRLPSEAEWEYAARAGTTTAFYWGDDPAQACSYANVGDQAAEAAIKRDYDGLESIDHVGVVPCNDKSGYASIVGTYKPNAFGLHDMIGNMYEFTADCHNDTFSEKNADGSARTDGDCNKRVIRGGNWHWEPFNASKRGEITDFGSSLMGFRIVEEMDSKHPCQDVNSRACKKLTHQNKFSHEIEKARKQIKNK